MMQYNDTEICISGLPACSHVTSCWIASWLWLLSQSASSQDVTVLTVMRWWRWEEEEEDCFCKTPRWNGSDAHHQKPPLQSVFLSRVFLKWHQNNWDSLIIGWGTELNWPCPLYSFHLLLLLCCALQEKNLLNLLQTTGTSWSVLLVFWPCRAS